MISKAPFEPFLRWLRGDYNSVRFKFWTLPLQWLRYILCYRLLGRSWIDFYADRLDAMSTESTVDDISEAYVDSGKGQIVFLKNNGLRPNDDFLDLGCGVLRGGVFVIPYLEKGCYVGADISLGRMETGRELARQRGIPDDHYDLVVVKDNELRELQGRMFDVVWAKSVLTHMPRSDIHTLLRSLKGILKPDGRFLFTFSVAETSRRRNIKDFWYTVEDMRGMCEDAGYAFRVLEDWDPEVELDWMGEIRVAGKG